MILIDDNWVMTQFENVISISTLHLKLPNFKWFGVPKINIYFCDQYVGIVLK
jgi:hypothetical protein